MAIAVLVHQEPVVHASGGIASTRVLNQAPLSHQPVIMPSIVHRGSARGSRMVNALQVRTCPVCIQVWRFLLVLRLFLARIVVYRCHLGEAQKRQTITCSPVW